MKVGYVKPSEIQPSQIALAAGFCWALAMNRGNRLNDHERRILKRGAVALRDYLEILQWTPPKPAKLRPRR
jgi:hypothetical protein